MTSTETKKIRQPNPIKYAGKDFNIPNLESAERLYEWLGRVIIWHKQNFSK